MNASHLIGMLNRMGDFFEAMPDRAEALQGMAQHIDKFWEPRMRRQLAQLLAQPEWLAQLRPVVQEALLPHAAAYAQAGQS